MCVSCLSPSSRYYAVAVAVQDTMQWLWETDFSRSSSFPTCQKFILCKAAKPEDWVLCASRVGDDCSAQKGCSWTGGQEGLEYLCGLNPSVSAFEWKPTGVYPNKEVAQCLKAPAIFCPQCSSADVTTAEARCQPECFMKGGPCDLTQNPNATWLATPPLASTPLLGGEESFLAEALAQAGAASPPATKPALSKGEVAAVVICVLLFFVDAGMLFLFLKHSHQELELSTTKPVGYKNTELASLTPK